MRVLSLIAERRFPSLCTTSSQTFPVNAFVLTHIGRPANGAQGPDKRSATIVAPSPTSIRRQIDAKIPPPWYIAGVDGKRAVNPGTYTQSHTPIVVQRAGWGGGVGVDGLPFPTVFDMLQYFVKILHSLENIDLLYKVRYSLWVVALLEACDVTSNGRHLGCHLGFYHELEIRQKR